MANWSDKYLGVKYVWGSRDLSVGSDCLRLIEVVLKNEKGYIVKEGGAVTEDWYKNHPSRLIESAVKHGEILTRISQLREFDVVFFKMDKKIVNHMGIVVDNFGRFLHQLIKRPSRLDRIYERHWESVFHCGVRIDFGK